MFCRCQTEDAESTLQVIQRGLVLLTNHLESFRKRYAFHLRIWQLDGAGISSHQKSQQDKQSVSLRVVLQPGGTSEKVCDDSVTRLINILNDTDADFRHILYPHPTCVDVPK